MYPSRLVEPAGQDFVGSFEEYDLVGYPVSVKRSYAVFKSIDEGSAPHVHHEGCLLDADRLVADQFEEVLDQDRGHIVDAVITSIFKAVYRLRLSGTAHSGDYDDFHVAFFSFLSGCYYFHYLASHHFNDCIFSGRLSWRRVFRPLGRLPFQALTLYASTFSMFTILERSSPAILAFSIPFSNVPTRCGTWASLEITNFTSYFAHISISAGFRWV